MFRKMLLMIFISVSIFGQVEDLKLDDKLPFDKEVKVGKLDNGLTYYIKHNKKPENRAFLRLAINAGSILEDEDQRGLAHFVEHMAFNGTKNFEKQEIIDYLESIGMKFGPEINAYTSFDETVYMIEVPLDSIEFYEKGFQILKEWATNIAFDHKEIDKERGVVIEEWRLGRGAWARIRDKQFPVIFKDSKYAERLPIGKKEVIENADYETIKRFYKDWYRPDLMGVFVVGEINVKETEELIKNIFSDIPKNDEVRERIEYGVPDLNETRVAIASDKELPITVASINYMKERTNLRSVNDYRDRITQNLYDGMFNTRLNEITQEADPPFLNAYASGNNILRTKGAYALQVVVKEDGIISGINRILAEAKRVREFGFTPSEFERQKKIVKRRMEKYYVERDKIESSNIIGGFVQKFLNNDPVISIDDQYVLFNKLVDGITIEEVNKLSTEILNNNRVITLSAPEKENLTLPSEEELEKVLKESENLVVESYKEEVSDDPLISELPSGGKIVEENKIDELGISHLKLSNGIKVYLKSTDFKNDEIIFRAISPGGNSLVKDEDYTSSAVASWLISEGGLNKFTKIELQKKLAGKIVGVSPWIGELYEGLSGSCSTEDIETLFQLIYLNFVSPRKDSTAFLSVNNRVKAFLKNKDADPGTAYSDTLSVTMNNYHYRARPWTQNVFDEIDFDKAFDIYNDRFAEAGDFTFIFVGNFEEEKIKPFIEKYLSILPVIKRVETWKDVGRSYPKGVIKKEVYKGLEPKSSVDLRFTGDYNWNKKDNFAFDALTEYLDIKLREVIREEKSGSYGVSVWGSADRFPRETYSLGISFGCDPGRAEELTNEIFSQIDSLKNFVPKESYIKKIKEGKLRSYEEALKQNSFWLSKIEYYSTNQLDLTNMLNFEEEVEKYITVEAIHEAAKKYFDMNNYARFIHYPENYN